MAADNFHADPALTKTCAKLPFDFFSDFIFLLPLSLPQFLPDLKVFFGLLPFLNWLLSGRVGSFAATNPASGQLTTKYQEALGKLSIVFNILTLWKLR